MVRTVISSEGVIRPFQMLIPEQASSLVKDASAVDGE